MIGPEELALERYMDGIADSYGYERATKNVANRLRSTLILRHVTQTSTVLDVGCANGLYLRIVAPHCKHVIGIDINERVLTRAREKIAEECIRNAEILRRNARDLDFATASFDLAYCFGTLSVVPDDVGIFREIARILRPGGHVIFDIAGSLNLGQLHWRRWWGERGINFNAYRYRTIVALLQSLGLIVTEAHAMGVADQWKSVPVLKHFSLLDQLFHGQGELDLDYRISNFCALFPFASRWYLVCQRLNTEGDIS